jgi:hypothetical protein
MKSAPEMSGQPKWTAGAATVPCRDLLSLWFGIFALSNIFKAFLGSSAPEASTCPQRAPRCEQVLARSVVAQTYHETL